jgi:AsmA protein
MGKLLKILLSVAGVLVALVVVAVIVLPLVINPNDYKQEIVNVVHDRTGRTLKIDGDISLSVFPWLGLDIGATRLGNATGFAQPYMASVQAVQVRVKLLPLLRKQLEVDTVRLDGLQLNLAKDKSGKTNWADLETAGKAPEEKPAQPGGGGAPLEHLAIGGISISNAQLSWDDRQGGAHYDITGLSLDTGTITEGEPFDVRFGFGMASKAPPLQARFGLTGTVELGAELKKVAVHHAVITLDASGDGVPGGKQHVSLATDVAVDLDAQTLSLPEVVLEALGVKVSGKIAGTGITGKTPKFSGNLRVAEFAPRKLITALGQPAPATTDPAVLDKASATLAWTATTSSLAVSELKLVLDDTHANGNLRVDSFTAPAIGFKLDVDTFDLDRYMPPPPPKGAAAAPAAAEESAPPQLDALRKLNLNGTIHVARLKAANLSYQDAELTVHAKGGVVRMHPIGAQLYGGSYNGDIQLDVSGKPARVSVNEHVNHVQAGPLLKDLVGQDRLLGTANLSAQFHATGLTPEALRRSVSGNAAFTFTDGTVKGVNIASLIRKAQAALKGQPLAPDNTPNQTDFAELKGTAVVTNGLVRNDDLTLQSPLLRIAGQGQTNLADETIDYTLTTKLVGSLEGQGGKGLEELKGVEIPVHVGGTYSKPTWRPDVGAALSAAAKAKVKEKVNEKIEEQKQKLQQKLGDQLLKGLFK